MRITNTRTALITGATRGIGREVARQLKASGFDVFVTGRDAHLLESLQIELRCQGLPLDLTFSEAAVQLFAAALQKLGRVDVLVNNAGFNRAKTPLAKVTPEELDASFAVNVRAPILLAREALKEMAPRKSGHILNVISSVAHTSIENYSVYSTMKYASPWIHGMPYQRGQAGRSKGHRCLPGGRRHHLPTQCSSGLHASGVGSADDCSMHFGSRGRRGTRLTSGQSSKQISERLKRSIDSGAVDIAFIGNNVRYSGERSQGCRQLEAADSHRSILASQKIFQKNWHDLSADLALVR